MVSSLLHSGRNRICTVIAITACVLPLVAAAEAPPLQPNTVPSEAVEMAPVLVDGATLFRLRGISSFPAKTRAKLVASRIKAVARDESVNVSQLRIVEADNRSDIFAGEQHIVSIFDVDAAAERLDSRQMLANLNKDSIAKAITRYRYERSRAYLLPQGMHGGIVVALLVALLLLLRWLFRWIARLLERHFQSRLDALKERSFRLLSAQDLNSAWHGIVTSLRMLILVVLVLVGLDYVLSLFPWTRPFALATVTLLITPLKTMWDGVVRAIPGLAFIAVLFFVTRYVLTLTQIFFRGIASSRFRFQGFEQEWALPTFRLVRMLIIAFAFVIAYPYIPGSDSAAFKGISIFVGLLMSLGSTSIIANVLAGYMLIYRRAFRVGDRIQVGDIVGDVVEMRQQVIHLRTLKDEELTIPSSVMLNSTITNYSSMASQGGVLLHTTVGIGYDTPWRQVEAMLIEAARRTEGLLEEPPPFVLQTRLGDFGITYEINVHCDRPQQMPQLYTALHRNILDVFNEHGVQIMTPAYRADTVHPKVVPTDQWYAPPAAPPSGESR